MFVWNLEEGRVTEQMVVTIPATPGNLLPGLNVQNRCLDDIGFMWMDKVVRSVGAIECYWDDYGGNISWCC